MSEQTAKQTAEQGLTEEETKLLQKWSADMADLSAKHETAGNKLNRKGRWARIGSKGLAGLVGSTGLLAVVSNYNDPGFWMTLTTSAVGFAASMVNTMFIEYNWTARANLHQTTAGDAGAFVTEIDKMLTDHQLDRHDVLLLKEQLQARMNNIAAAAPRLGAA